MKKLITILLFLPVAANSQAIINPYVFGIPITYDTDAESYINRVQATGVLLTDAVKLSINTFVVDLKANSLWAKIYDAGMFIGGTASSHAETLKGVSDITWHGTLTHNASGSVSISAGYGSLGYNADVMTLNNSHISVYSGTNSPITNAVDFGCRASNTSKVQLFIKSGSNLTADMNNITAGNGRVTTALTNANGFFIASRVSNADFRCYQNGSQIGSTATTTHTGTMPAVELVIMADNNAGVIGGTYSTRRQQYWSVGAGLSVSEAATYSTLVQNLQTALSR